MLTTFKRIQTLKTTQVPAIKPASIRNLSRSMREEPNKPANSAGQNKITQTTGNRIFVKKISVVEDSFLLIDSEDAISFCKLRSDSSAAFGPVAAQEVPGVDRLHHSRQILPSKRRPTKAPNLSPPA